MRRGLLELLEDEMKRWGWSGMWWGWREGGVVGRLRSCVCFKEGKGSGAVYKGRTNVQGTTAFGTFTEGVIESVFI